MSLIYSYLNYCNIIWGGAYDIVLKPLYILQKKAIRLISNSHYLEHTAPLFKTLELLIIYRIFKYNCLLLVHKCTKDNYFPEFKKKLQSSIHSYETRNINQLRVPLEKLKVCQKSYKYISIKLCKAVNEDIRKINFIDIFKKKKLLIEGIN